MEAPTRQALKAGLAHAERHIFVGTRLIERQRETIRLMQRQGKNPQPAIDVLVELEDSMRSHVSARKRLRGELRQRRH